MRQVVTPAFLSADSGDVGPPFRSDVGPV
jgi:hypothetical protein